MVASPETELHVRRILLGDAEIDAMNLIAKSSLSATTAMDLHEELAHAFTHAWGAWAGDRTGGQRAAGFVLAWHVADELHVLDVATSPELRRRGVARALMGQCLRYASENGVRLVLLEVRASNHAAIALYRSHGFCATGVREKYYTDNLEDAVEMALAFDPVTGRVVDGGT